MGDFCFFKRLICSLSDYDHVVHDAVILSCGFSACRVCFDPTYECKNCKRLHEIFEETDGISKQVNSNLSYLSSMLDNKLRSYVVSNDASFEMKIQKRVDYLKEEVEITIESRKIEEDSADFECQQASDLDLRRVNLLRKLDCFALTLKNSKFLSDLNDNFIGLKDQIVKNVSGASVEVEEFFKKQEALRKFEKNLSIFKTCLKLVKIDFNILDLHLSGYCVKTLVEHIGAVLCVQRLKTGDFISGSADRSVKIWDVDSKICRGTLECNSGNVCCLLELDGDEILSALSNNTMEIWNIKSSQCVATLKGHKNIVLCLARLTTGEIISGSWDKDIKLWDLKTRKCVTTLKGHEYAVTCLLVLENSEIASGSYDSTIKIWNVSSKKCVHTLIGHEDRIECLCRLKNGDTMISGSWDKSIKLWNIKTRSCIATLKGHELSVLCLLETKAGRIISSSGDRSLKVWDTEANSCVLTLTGHTSRVKCLTELENNELVSSSYDKTIKIWQLF